MEHHITSRADVALEFQFANAPPSNPADNASLRLFLSGIGLAQHLDLLTELGFHDPDLSLAGMSFQDLRSVVGDKITPGALQTIIRAAFLQAEGGEKKRVADLPKEFVACVLETWMPEVARSGKLGIKNALSQELKMHIADDTKRLAWQNLCAWIDVVQETYDSGADFTKSPAMLKQGSLLINSIRARDATLQGKPGMKLLARKHAEDQGDDFGYPSRSKG